MKKKIILMLLIAAQLSTLACGDTSNSGNETTTSNDTTSAEVTTEADPLDALPQKYYDGETFTIAVRSGGDDGLYIEESTGDLLDDEVYARNSKIEDRFGIKFEAVESTDPYCSDAKTVILAGDSSYDIVAAHARSVFGFAHNELLLDWNTELPYVDLDQDWWNQDSRESFQIAGKLYTCSGDLIHGNLGSAVGMFYNKTIFEQLKIDNIYETVLNGDWTFELFKTYARQGSDDLNGDGSYDIDNDQFGYASSWWTGPIQILYSGGQRICGKDADNNLTLTLNTEKTVEIFDKFLSFVNEDCAYINKMDDGSLLTKAFTEGRLMFRDMTLNGMKGLREMNEDFGVIPCPKFDETMEKYYSNVDASCTLIGVPITCEDPEMVSIVLEALSSTAHTTTLPAFYEDSLQVKYSRDDESVKMLDLIREGRVFDIGYYYDNNSFVFEINSIGYQLVKNENTNFSSYYAQYESSALAKIEEINKVYNKD